MSRYGCTIRGQCEPSEYGDYPSLEACESECKGSEAVDLVYLILSYDWSKVVRATVTDQQELLRREFGLHVSRADTTMLVNYLDRNDILSLLKYSPAFVDYIEERISSLDLFLLELLEVIASPYPVDWSYYRQRATIIMQETLRRHNYARSNLGILSNELAVNLTYAVDLPYHNFHLVYDMVQGWLPELIRLLAPDNYNLAYPV